MKIKITKKVTDKETKEQHLPGQVVEKSQERGKVFISKGYAELAEKPKEVEDNDDPMNLKELAAYVAEIDSVEDLEGLAEVEKAGASRKGAFKIIDERIAELSE